MLHQSVYTVREDGSPEGEIVRKKVSYLKKLNFSANGISRTEQQYERGKGLQISE